MAKQVSHFASDVVLGPLVNTPSTEHWEVDWKCIFHNISPRLTSSRCQTQGHTESQTVSNKTSLAFDLRNVSKQQTALSQVPAFCFSWTVWFDCELWMVLHWSFYVPCEGNGKPSGAGAVISLTCNVAGKIASLISWHILPTYSFHFPLTKRASLGICYLKLVNKWLHLAPLALLY